VEWIGTEDLTEAVTRVGTAGYRAWTAEVQSAVEEIFFKFDYFPARIPAPQLGSAWRQAWADGIKPLGLTMEDLTGLELFALDAAIDRDRPLYDGFIQWVRRNNGSSLIPLRKPDGEYWEPDKWKRELKKTGTWGTVQNRMHMWWNAYHRVADEARMLAAADQPLQWVLGKAEHCRDCLSYAGRVYRGSTWAKWDIRPQHPSLACHGVLCACRLLVSTGPLTPGRPPGMTG